MVPGEGAVADTLDPHHARMLTLLRYCAGRWVEVPAPPNAIHEFFLSRRHPYPLLQDPPPSDTRRMGVEHLQPNSCPKVNRQLLFTAAPLTSEGKGTGCAVRVNQGKRIFLGTNIITQSVVLNVKKTLP